MGGGGKREGGGGRDGARQKQDQLQIGRRCEGSRRWKVRGLKRLPGFYRFENKKKRKMRRC